MNTTPKIDDATQEDAMDDIRAKTINVIKAETKAKLISQAVDPADNFSLPQPIFHEVPVHVTRNDARAVQAQPPPATQPLLSQRQVRERRDRRKRSGIGGGDDSDSDSERGGRKWGRGSPDRVLQRPKVPAPAGLVRPPAGSASTVKPHSDLLLSPEEEERVNTLRALRRLEDDWGDRLRHRSQKRAEGGQLRERLVKEAMTQGRTEGSNTESIARVQRQENALQEYLDDSLFADIADDRCKDTVNLSTSPEVSTRVILEAEKLIISALYYIGASTEMPLDATGHVQYICSEITYLRSKYTWMNLSDIERDLRAQMPETIYREFQSHVTAKTYWKVIEDAIVYASTSQWQDILRNSRGSDYLSTEYIEWVRLITNPLRESLIKESINKFRESMGAIQISVSQEFFRIDDSTVGMALLKSGRASTLKIVPREDLDRMGWYRDEGSGYWRYAVFKDQPGWVFRVDMDGEVLELVQSIGDDEFKD